MAKAKREAISNKTTLFNEVLQDEQATRKIRQRAIAKRKSLQRHAKLWLPFRKTLVLQGVRSPFGKVATCPREMLHELASSWSPFFTQTTIDLDKAVELIDKHSSFFDFTGVRYPIADLMIAYLRSCFDSCPGPDGQQKPST